MAAAATAAPLAGRAQAPLEPALGVPPVGTWATVANGDRVRAVLREPAGGDPSVAWTATEGGGVVRWDLEAGTWRQYLAPHDGLPSNDVRTLARGEGGLWAATQGGPARLADGAARWSRVAVTHPDLASVAATAVAVAADGGVWFGFEQRWDPAAVDPDRGEPGAFVGGGVARFDPATGAWGPVFRAAGAGGRDERFAPLPSANVTALAFDHAGRLWAATRPFYAWHADNDSPSTGAGAWTLVGGGLAVTGGPPGGAATWTSWQAADFPCVASTVYAVAIDILGNAWAGTAGRGLHVYTRGPNTVPCGAMGGHAEFRRGRGPGGGLAGNSVRAVAIGADDAIWVAASDGSDTPRGIARLKHGFTLAEHQTDDDQWHRVSFGREWPTALVSALDVRDEELLIGTIDTARGDGFGLLRGEITGPFPVYSTATAGLPSNRITAVAVDERSGAAWFGTAARGVARRDASGWRTWRGSPGGDGPAGDAVSGIAVGPDGRVWVTSRRAVWDPATEAWADGGLAGFDGQTWTRYRSGAPGGPPAASAEAVAVDPTTGRVWVATKGGGAAVFNPAAGTWAVFDRASAVGAFGGNNVTGVAIDPATGDAWLAHGAGLDCDPAKLPGACDLIRLGGGVSRWDGARWERWSKSAGAPIEAEGSEGEMTAMFFDRGRGRAWAGAWASGPDGFHWFEGRGIDAAVNGCDRDCGADGWSAARFVNGGAVQALASDAAGRLWVGLSIAGNGIVPPATGVRILDAGGDASGPTAAGRWSALRAIDGLPSDEVTALAASGDGMWIGTLDRAAALWRPFEVRDRAFLPVANAR